jgi:hypothetical protein
MEIPPYAIIDKWDVENYRCRECKHLISLKEGAQNVYGKWMTPKGFWFRLVCPYNRKYILDHTRKNRVDCPFFEQK